MANLALSAPISLGQTGAQQSRNNKPGNAQTAWTIGTTSSSGPTIPTQGLIFWAK